MGGQTAGITEQEMIVIGVRAGQGGGQKLHACQRMHWTSVATEKSDLLLSPSKLLACTATFAGMVRPHLLKLQIV